MTTSDLHQQRHKIGTTARWSYPTGNAYEFLNDRIMEVANHKLEFGPGIQLVNNITDHPDGKKRLMETQTLTTRGIQIDATHPQCMGIWCREENKEINRWFGWSLVVQTKAFENVPKEGVTRG